MFGAMKNARLPEFKNSTIDVEGVIAFFGGRKTIVDEIRRFNIANITIAAVHKWAQRGQIPAHHLMSLTTLSERLKMKFDINKFITSAEAAPQQKAS